MFAVCGLEIRQYLEAILRSKYWLKQHQLQLSSGQFGSSQVENSILQHSQNLTPNISLNQRETGLWHFLKNKLSTDDSALEHSSKITTEVQPGPATTRAVSGKPATALQVSVRPWEPQGKPSWSQSIVSQGHAPRAGTPSGPCSCCEPHADLGSGA